MPRSRHRFRAQLALALEPRKAQPPVAPTLKGIVEALAELLLDAAQAKRPTRQGGFDERRITTEHLRRAAVVYVRQSTMAQVMGNLESQRRQYDLAGEAQAKALPRSP